MKIQYPSVWIQVKIGFVLKPLHLETTVTESIVGPGTFQAVLELYKVAGPAGLYPIKLEVGNGCRFTNASS